MYLFRTPGPLWPYPVYECVPLLTGGPGELAVFAGCVGFVMTTLVLEDGSAETTGNTSTGLAR